MSNVAISFASLIKFNNGFFKSEAQAKFLLSQCQEDNVFSTSGSVYNNSYTLSYNCDSMGVVSVEKYTPKSSKSVTTWVRLTATQHQDKVAKDVAAKEANTLLNDNIQAKYQARVDAFNNILLMAQQLVSHKTSVPLNVIQSVLKDADGVIAALTVLLQDQSFNQAWEAYKAM